LVRILPLRLDVVTRLHSKTDPARVTGSNFRTICDCQRHAHRRQRWDRAMRMILRCTTVLAIVPFAYSTDIPLHPIKQIRRAAKPHASQSEMPVFTTPGMREQFLSTLTVQQSVSIDSFKEQFFRTYVPYGSIIYREARKNGLPPELVAAMVHTESDFRPGLVSHRSAQGLMQIVPETAHDLGLSNVFDPAENIAAGTRYFRYLLNRFENERIALAAYNAGEGKVERCNCVPSIDETEQYIDRVHARASRYRQRVQNGYLAMLKIQPDVAH
jgi:hypothetical protein